MGLVPLVAHPIPPPMLYMCIRFWYVCTYTHACHNSVRTYVRTYVCMCIRTMLTRMYVYYYLYYYILQRVIDAKDCGG